MDEKFLRDFFGMKPGEAPITLRDYFAASALQGLLAGRLINHAESRKHPIVFSGDAPHWAAIAYAFADAMLAERSKR